MGQGRVSKVCCLWLVAAPLSGFGQAAKPAHAAHAQPKAAVASTAVSAAVQESLAKTAAAAGVIFAGHVLEVARHDDAGYVDIRFRIDEPVRGCNKLGIYVLREWVGLWSGKPPRYTVGQRLLMLLAPRGASGMSAPVGGDEGLIPIQAGATEPLADGNGVAPAEDGSQASDVTGMTADLRWVQARLPRKLAYASDTAAPVVPGEPVSRWGPVEPVAEGLGSVAAQPSVGSVLDVLRAVVGTAPAPGSGHVVQ